MSDAEGISDISESDASGVENVPKITSVFLVEALEDFSLRDVVCKQIQQCISEDDDSTYDIIHLGHCGWDAVGQVFSPTYFAMSLCRRFKLLPSERCTLLPLRDQYQAIQLCLAKINKKKHGDFSAPVSDVLDVWNEVCRETLSSNKAENSLLKSIDDEEEDCDLDLPSSRRKSYDPVVREMQEIVNDYQELLKSSGFVDHFFIYSTLKDQLEGKNKDLIAHISSKVYTIEGVSHMPTMEKELLKLLFTDSKATKVSVVGSFSEEKSFCEFDMSGIGEEPLNTSHVDVSESKVSQKGEMEEEKKRDGSISTAERSDIVTEALDSSLHDYIESLARSPLATDFSDSELYVEQLMLAHIRLLINTRDELALATLCSMPGREITQHAFHEIKEDALKKNMPMYQTILSFIMRLRLGGKGYQVDPDCPILLYSKPLGEFVDSIMKLQNIVEEEPNPRKGAVKVLSLIKSGLLRIRGRALKGSCIEKVWDTLYSAFDRLTTNPDHTEVIKASTIQQTTGALRPCLKLLLELCDEASSRTAEEVDALSDNVLTQCNSSKKTTTPVRIPTVMSLFRSPDPVAPSPGLAIDDEECEGSLRMRLLRCKGLTPKNKSAPKFNSGCAWAPDNLSPIGKGDSDLDKTLSPIVGPTLKAVGNKSNIGHNNWKEIVEAVSQQEEERKKECAFSSPKPKGCGGPSKGKKLTEDKKSKRSLLSDISNIGTTTSDTSNNKKSKPNAATKKSPVKKKSKSAPILKGQKSITSFFKV